jgi:hypothetical protein
VDSRFARAPARGLEHIMLKKLTAVALTAAALALNAPAAHADAPVRTCRFVAAATGSDFTGVAFGYIAHSDGNTVSISCHIRVNGTPIGSTVTPTTTAPGSAATAGPVTFTAGDTDTVEICTVFSSSHGAATECFGTISAGIPPQEIIDVLCQVTRIVSPINILNVVVIETDGDVLLAGRKILSCTNPTTGSPVILRYA